MNARELAAYAIGLGLSVALVLFIWGVRRSRRQSTRQDLKNVRIDLMRRPGPQSSEEADGSR